MNIKQGIVMLRDSFEWNERGVLWQDQLGFTPAVRVWFFVISYFIVFVLFYPFQSAPFITCLFNLSGLVQFQGWDKWMKLRISCKCQWCNGNGMRYFWLNVCCSLSQKQKIFPTIKAMKLGQLSAVIADIALTLALFGVTAEYHATTIFLFWHRLKNETVNNACYSYANKWRGFSLHLRCYKSLLLFADSLKWVKFHE